MGGDGPVSRKSEDLRAATSETENVNGPRKAPTLETLPNSIESLNTARAAFGNAERGAIASLLPLVLMGPEEGWKNPSTQLAAAKGLFANHDTDDGTAPADFDYPLKLAQRKAGQGAPLDAREDARLKAYWLFKRADSPTKMPSDTRGLELATENFSPTNTLTPKQKMELAGITIKTLQERHQVRGGEPPNISSKWEQLDERVEFNNALDVIANGLKTASVGAVTDAQKKDRITDPRTIRDCEAVIKDVLAKRQTNLKITDDKLTQFIEGKLTSGKLPTHAVITTGGAVELDKAKALELRKTGKGLSVDDACLLMPGVKRAK